MRPDDADDSFYAALDPGIRETVRWLHRNGFGTTDSGDGSKAATMECAVPFPMIAVSVPAVHALVDGAQLLRSMVGRLGVGLSPDGHGLPSIVASYDAADGSAVILLTRIDDALLFGAEVRR
jgi:hypothetical protein